MHCRKTSLNSHDPKNLVTFENPTKIIAKIRHNPNNTMWPIWLVDTGNPYVLEVLEVLGVMSQNRRHCFGELDKYSVT